MKHPGRKNRDTKHPSTMHAISQISERIKIIRFSMLGLLVYFDMNEVLKNYRK
jgi:hypothetical protein